MKRQNDRILKEELPRLVGAQYATGDQWRNNSRKNEGLEPKQKQYPAVDVTGDRSKIRCCKEQYCIGTWNVRSSNQGKLEEVKQEMARVNIDILGISELKWTEMGEFNSDDHYIYYYGQKSLRRNGVAIMASKRVRNAVLGCNLKNDRMISETIIELNSVQSFSCVQLFATVVPVHTNSWSLLKLMSIESVMPSNHHILCHPLFLTLSIFPTIRVFSSESVLHIRWPKYWSFSFRISPSNEYSGLISFRMDWLDLLAVQGTLKSLLQHRSSRA